MNKHDTLCYSSENRIELKKKMIHLGMLVLPIMGPGDFACEAASRVCPHLYPLPYSKNLRVKYTKGAGPTNQPIKLQPLLCRPLAFKSHLSFVWVKLIQPDQQFV